MADTMPHDAYAIYKGQPFHVKNHLMGPAMLANQWGISQDQVSDYYVSEKTYRDYNQYLDNNKYVGRPQGPDGKRPSKRNYQTAWEEYNKTLTPDATIPIKTEPNSINGTLSKKIAEAGSTPVRPVLQPGVLPPIDFTPNFPSVAQHFPVLETGGGGGGAVPPNGHPPIVPSSGGERMPIAMSEASYGTADRGLVTEQYAKYYERMRNMGAEGPIIDAEIVEDSGLRLDSPKPKTSKGTTAPKTNGSGWGKAGKMLLGGAVLGTVLYNMMSNGGHQTNEQLYGQQPVNR